jgi:nitroreductase/NAD-dependent dihydropyrimidine dehydrogenase PreA subunit
MSLLRVDKEKCDQEGICVATCPLRLIVMDEDDYPAPVPYADEVCIRCGHCVAVCPAGALRHRDLDLNQFEPIQESLKISLDQCKQFFRSRRSIRAFRERAVSKEKLARLIEIAGNAPTGRNCQDVDWMVLCDRSELKKLSSIVMEFYGLVIEGGIQGIDPNPHLGKIIEEWESGINVVLHNAPALIIAHADQGYHLASTDCIIALSNLELAATGMGLGCCWAGFFMTAAINYPPMIKALSLPEGHQCFGAMMVGYPRFKYHRQPPRKPPVITWRM